MTSSTPRTYVSLERSEGPAADHVSDDDDQYRAELSRTCHRMAGLNSGPPALTAGAPPPGTATPGTQSATGIWERAANDSRWNPVYVPKSPSAVIAHGEAIRLPPGREISTGNASWASSIGGMRRGCRWPAPMK